MKSFENWANIEPGYWDDKRKDVARIAWKAALEFVVRDLCCGCNYTSDDVKKEIKEELEQP